MQLSLNKPVVLTNPGTASGLKVWLQFAADFGDCEVRVLVYSNGGWSYLGAATPNSNGEPRVVVRAGDPDNSVALLDSSHRKVSAMLTFQSVPNAIVCIDLNSTLGA